MHDWLLELQPGQRVLDLCSGVGSFDVTDLPCAAIALDEDEAAFHAAAVLPPGPYWRVVGASGRIPFAGGSFDLVICHHGLEHIPNVEETLAEIGRILKPDGRLVISIPNGYGLCDSIYRFVFGGGGHVNRFTWRQAVDSVEHHAGVRLESWHKLYSSFAYLYRLARVLENGPISLPSRARILLKMPRQAVYAAQRSLYRSTRWCDRLFHTDTSVYGWAFYFSHSSQPVTEQPAYLNVCLNCGSGHPVAGMDRRSRFVWHCNACDTMNPFVRPFRHTR